MFALEPVIADRVRDVLVAPWQVFGRSTDPGQRNRPPQAVVAFAATNVADSKTGAALVQAGWRISLTARKGDEAAGLLDAAFVAIVAQLHNWSPGEVAGRRWERLSLIQVIAPEDGEEGLVNADLVFNTAARFDGQD